MLLFRLVVPVLLLACAIAPAHAASFDCSAAETPFEKAICENPDLSNLDEVLSKSFATAIGGLTKDGVTAVRADQRTWLEFAQRACSDDVRPLSSGSYNENAVACLADIFGSRSSALENSRMQGGHRFYMLGTYGAVPDPNEVDNPDSYWKVAKHELVYPQLDGDDALAEGFNGFLASRMETLAQIGTNPDVEDMLDPTADTDVVVKVVEVTGTKRITLEATSYWYGHGAAHGSHLIQYLHYYVPEEREVDASDIFAGEGWEKTLADLAWTQLQIEHKEWLQVESVDDIAEIVMQPTRWDLSDDYGLVIQFQPYEISAYAYGAPTITVPWEKLDAIQAEGRDAVRFGF